jgi:hypothetical protein
MTRPIALVLTLLVFSGATLSQAQEPAGTARPEVHRGFWIGFGLGGGTNLSDFAEGARTGAGGYLRMGGTLSQHVLLGGEIAGWGRDLGGATFTESGLTATIMFYPVGRGLFLKGGAGFAGWSTSASAGGTTTTSTAAGFAGTAGIGYDVQIGGNIFLTPNVDFLYHTLSSENTAWADISSGAVLLFTLGLTWH